jgi:DNA-binding CsgD family transcriptional regulator
VTTTTNLLPLGHSDALRARSNIAYAMSAARTAPEIAAVMCRAASDLVDGAVMVGVLEPVESGFESLYAMGDVGVVVDLHRERDVAFRHRRIVHRPARDAVGMCVLEVPLCLGPLVVGLLEVIAPTTVFDEDVSALAALAVHTAQELHRAGSDKQGRSNLAHRAASSFALGLEIAQVIQRAGHRTEAIRAAVRLLNRRLRVPIAGWEVVASPPALRLRQASGVPASQRAALLQGTFEFEFHMRERRRLRRVLLARVAAILQAPEAFLLDAGVALFVAREQAPELSTAGAQLERLISAMPTLEFTEPVMGDGSHPTSLEVNRLEPLTAREREVLLHLAVGASTAQIAKKLSISPKTVKTHVQNILSKLGVSSRLEAATLATQAGLRPRAIY